MSTRTRRQDPARTRLEALRQEYARARKGALLPWGVTMCAGPGPPGHDEPCEGCPGRQWACEQAEEIAREVSTLEARLGEPLEGVIVTAPPKARTRAPAAGQLQLFAATTEETT